MIFVYTAIVTFNHLMVVNIEHAQRFAEKIRSFSSSLYLCIAPGIKSICRRHNKIMQ